MQVKVIASLAQVAAQDWNRLLVDAYPFLRHEYLSALERSGAASLATGWQARHLLVLQGESLIAALPMYQKQHSWGEYVFDQQWALAHEQYGLEYYPKWLTAIPFTPCLGPRLLIAPEVDARLVWSLVLDHVRAQAISSWHCLFPDAVQLGMLREMQLIVRYDVQFQWFNRGYKDFGDYLQALNASKRKMIKKERRRITEQGIDMLQIAGTEATPEQWHVAFQFYSMTYYKRRREPYLSESFFRQIAKEMAESCILVFAVKDAAYVGAALFFVGSDCLYGRFWGCREEYDVLHFEACYYQGLEFCIQQGLQRFDSGAQGEHKIARGFEPILTQSAHWIKDPRFARLIADFTEREKQHVLKYQTDAARLLPFKQTTAT